MTNQHLTVSLSNPPGTSASYWVRLEQESQEPDGATLEQIAQIADRVYEIDPCGGVGAFAGGQNLSPHPSIAETVDAAKDNLARASETQRVAAEILKLPICGEELPGTDIGTFNAMLRVYRSLVCRDYTLVLTKGSGIIGSKFRIQEDIEITIVVEGFEADLELPISRPCDPNDNYDYVFECDAEVIKTVGSKLLFKNYTDVAHIRYTTEYDRYEVMIHGVGGLATKDAEATVFYQGLVAKIEIEPPPLDDGGKITCLTISGTTIGGGGEPEPPPGPDDPVCYQTTTITEKCACTGKKHDSYDIKTEVACPESETEGAHGVGETINRTSYVDCGIIDEYGTDEFFQEKCCVDEGHAPVRCKKQYSVWNGGAGGSSKLDAYRGKPNVSLIPVSPEDGICGVQIIEQKVTGSCCEDAEPMEVTPSDDKIKPNGKISIEVIGDLGPIKWKCNSGYHFGQGKREVETSTPGGVVLIYDNENPTCDDAKVGVSGQCDTHTLEITLDLSDIEPLEAVPTHVTAMPGSYVQAGATGGLPPYKYTASGGLVEVSPGLFLCPSDFCGTAEITITDLCGDTATMTVKSTAGHWEQINSGVQCSLPGHWTMPSDVHTYSGQSDCGKYHATIAWQRSNTDPAGGCGGDLLCGKGNLISNDNGYPAGDCDTIVDSTYSGFCCTFDCYYNQQLVEDCTAIYGQYAQGLAEWICP